MLDRLAGPDLAFPDQIAGLSVQRLNDAARADQIHDAVVDERHGLVGAILIAHRPHPRQTKPADVGAGDVGKRTVAPGPIRTPRHQPIAGRGIAQHLVSHRHVVLDRAGHRDPSPRRRECRCGRWSRSSCGDRRRGTIQWPVDQREKRRDVERVVGGQAITSRRHRALDVVSQALDVRVQPPHTECGAAERRCFSEPSEVGLMAARASGVVDHAARCRLRSRERRSGRRLLSRRECDGEQCASDDEGD